MLPMMMSVLHAFTQLVAPKAVKMADATDAMICTIHLIISFFVIVVQFLHFYIFTFLHCSGSGLEIKFSPKTSTFGT